MEVRMALEELSARLAARNRSEEQVRAIVQARQALGEVFGQSRGHRGRLRVPPRDRGRIGQRLAGRSAGPVSERVKGGMNVTLSLTREASEQRRARVLDEHDRIVHAIRTGDADSAAIAMRYHLDQARNRLLDRHLDR